MKVIRSSFFLLFSISMGLVSCYEEEDSPQAPKLPDASQIPAVPESTKVNAIVMFVYMPDSELIAERTGWNEAIIKNRLSTWNEAVNQITEQLKPQNVIPMTFSKEVISYNALMEMEIDPSGSTDSALINRFVHLRLLFDEGEFVEVPTENAVFFNKTNWNTIDINKNSPFLSYVSHVDSAKQTQNFLYQYVKFTNNKVYTSSALFTKDHLAREDRQYVRTRDDMIKSDVTSFVTWFQQQLQ